MTSHSLWCHLEPQCHASYAPSWPRIRKHPWCQTPQYLQVFVINILVWQHPLAKRSTNLPFFCHSDCIKLSIVRDRYNNTKRLNRRRGNVEVFTYRYLCPTYYELGTKSCLARSRSGANRRYRGKLQKYRCGHARLLKISSSSSSPSHFRPAFANCISSVTRIETIYTSLSRPSGSKGTISSDNEV